MYITLSGYKKSLDNTDKAHKTGWPISPDLSEGIKYQSDAWQGLMQSGIAQSTVVLLDCLFVSRSEAPWLIDTGKRISPYCLIEQRALIAEHSFEVQHVLRGGTRSVQSEIQHNYAFTSSVNIGQTTHISQTSLPSPTATKRRKKKQEG
uniref:Uncharacterized protein n=1 Tax=Kwoniella pini CBS 10737 TaxID=1296096 RepID=A0A1B9I731_9TREE|nr:uncharacterized protein I206_02018 [Kwoniella pini CBS 10737]OCF51304.1 hypothetical protein I206_02018 [Kwoniella pini CBS 10737]